KKAEQERRHLETRLRQSEKMEAIGQLAGGVAHDFNNLLTAIQGNAELLESSLDPESEDHEMVSEVLIASRQAGELTKKLLAFAWTGVTQSVPLNLHELLVRVRGLMTRSIGPSIKVVTKLDAERSDVSGDQSQIQTAVLNLAVNARDAMPEGGRLTVATRNVRIGRAGDEPEPALPPGEYIELAVSDTGTGIDPELQKRIFEPFFTTKKKDKGTGLGLACVYGCATRHGGSVRVESSPGQGATFRLLLPVVETEAVPTAPLPHAKRAASGRILLIDDQPFVRSYGTRALERLGYSVTACADGQEAVRLFRERAGDFALVILDMIMPGMPGARVFAELRRIDPTARILLCSGFTQSEAIDKLLEQGAAGFLAKPFDIETLSSRLAEWLDEPRG
ncbi:ATP-binding protein, partial [Verrucomicrobiota bacterium]